MFSVSGWTVTAPLKTQTKPIAPPPALPSSGANNEKLGSKKRKRGRGGQGGGESNGVSNESSKVTLEQAEPLPPAGTVKKEKQQKKRRKVENDEVEEQKRIVDQSAEKITEKGVKASSTATPVTEGVTSETQKRKRARRQDKKKDKSESIQDFPIQSKDDIVEKLKSPKSITTKSEVPVRPSHASKSMQVPGNPTKLTPMQAAMRAKLASARFRHLNEALYTSPSEKALDLITNDPSTFEEYHSGFRRQVEVWPENPVDSYIADIKQRGANKSAGKDNSRGQGIEDRVLPRTHGTCTIADLGCGDAKLASDLQDVQQKLNVKIVSFDLHSPSPLVQRADVADLPLEDGSVSVAIFCLALMGTNWPDFIEEAWRILHWKGELWIAEIKSRFGRVEKAGSGSGRKVVDHSVGKRQKPRSKMSEAEKKREDGAKRDEDDTLAVEVDGASIAKGTGATDVTTFVKVLKTRGFVLDGDDGDQSVVDKSNKMFVKMRFIKAAQPTKGKNVKKGADGATWKPKGKKFGEVEVDIDEKTVLKPCVYKLR